MLLLSFAHLNRPLDVVIYHFILFFLCACLLPCCFLARSGPFLHHMCICIISFFFFVCAEPIIYDVSCWNQIPFFCLFLVSVFLWVLFVWFTHSLVHPILCLCVCVVSALCSSRFVHHVFSPPPFVVISLF